MNALTKKIIRTALVLGLISGISAGLVGVVYAVTEPKISENDVYNKTSGMVQIYGGSATDYVEDETIKSYIEKGLLSYVTGVYTYYGEGENNGKKVVSGEGTNSYGDVGLMIGVSADGSELGKLVIVKNTESYKSTLEKKYITVYQSANDALARKDALNDVSCGATYGATLIRNIVNEGVSAIKGDVIKDKTVLDEEGKKLLGSQGENAVYENISERYLAFKGYQYIKRGWKALDNSGSPIGYVYYLYGSSDDSTESTSSFSIELEVGIYNNASLANACVASVSDSNMQTSIKEKIDTYNSSSDKDSLLNGWNNTAEEKLLSSMIKEVKACVTDVSSESKQGSQKIENRRDI